MTDKFFFTPTELLAKYPNQDLTFQDIGYALRLKILVGEKNKYGCKITEKSFLEYLELRKTTIEKQDKLNQFLKTL
jgi:hypothetical protein